MDFFTDQSLENHMASQKYNGAGVLNVNGTDDPDYRYKMPEVKINIIAKKGGMTVFENCQDIASAIYRNTTDIKKYLSKRLGNPIKAKDGQLLITGKVNQSVIQSYIYDFIKDVVLCVQCGSPETVENRCQACGKEV